MLLVFKSSVVLTITALIISFLALYTNYLSYREESEKGTVSRVRKSSLSYNIVLFAVLVIYHLLLIWFLVQNISFQ